MITCKKINSWYSNSKHYLEIVCQKRQVYRLDTLKACEKWIEVINSSIIYSKFWNSLIQKNPEIYNYYWNQKEELETILDVPDKADKANDEKNKKEDINETKGNSSENDKKKNTSSNISNEQQSSAKKKERRKNPYSMMNGIFIITK